MEKEITIDLSGFREIESDVMGLIDKMLQKHKTKLLIYTKKPKNLHITLKPVHKREKGEIYEIHTKVLDNGKVFVSEAEDRNLLAAVDTSLERVLKEIEKKNH